MPITKREVDGAYVLDITGDYKARYVLGLSGKLDPDCDQAKLKAAVAALPERSVILLNFSNLEKDGAPRPFDADFVGALVPIDKDAKQKGSVLGIWGISNKLRTIFETMQLDTVLNVLPGRRTPGEFPTETSAIAKLQEITIPEPSRGKGVERLVAAAAVTAVPSAAQA